MLVEVVGFENPSGSTAHRHMQGYFVSGEEESGDESRNSCLSLEKPMMA
jgi:hypothetical protein